MRLKKLRNKIDLLDSQIVGLLNKRAKLTLDIGSIKIKHGKNIYSPRREKEVLKKIKQKSKGPLSKEALEAIYREVMSASLSLEKYLRIHYQ